MCMKWVDENITGIKANISVSAVWLMARVVDFLLRRRRVRIPLSDCTFSNENISALLNYVFIPLNNWIIIKLTQIWKILKKLKKIIFSSVIILSKQFFFQQFLRFESQLKFFRF